MWQLIIGSLTLSVIHALIPNHWIPLIAISKAERWKTGETMLATFITAFFHLLSTILIGILVGLVGIRIFEKYEHFSHIIAPVVLITLGIIYLILDITKKYKHNHHDINLTSKKSKTAIITSLAIGMFFSPCIELEAYYFQAANFGMPGIFIVSVIYMAVTLTCIMGLVYLGVLGLNKFNSHFLEHHSKSITGGVLVILGIMSFFMEHHH